MEASMLNNSNTAKGHGGLAPLESADLSLANAQLPPDTAQQKSSARAPDATGPAFAYVEEVTCGGCAPPVRAESNVPPGTDMDEKHYSGA